MIASVYDKMEVSAYTFFVEAKAAGANAAGGQNAWPRGGVTRVTFKDNHMQYAVTWYGLALTVFAVYAFFFRSWWRQRGAV